MYIIYKNILNKINIIVFIYYKLYLYIFMYDVEFIGKIIIGLFSILFLLGIIKVG